MKRTNDLGLIGPADVSRRPSSNSVTQRVRALYEGWAQGYDRWARHYDRVMGLGEGRRRLLSKAHGRTLEVGVGTGANLRHYPADVRLTGVDLSPAMLDIARRRATARGLAIELQIGDGQALDMPDGSFETVVATLYLSVVPDDRRAAAEMGRVLRRGGTLLVLDHVRSTVAPVRWFQRLLEPIMATYFGWRFTRDPLDYLASLGYVIEDVRRSRLGMVKEIVARKH